MAKAENSAKSSKESTELAPTVSDFSSVAIRRALRRHTLNHWTTRYSTVPLGLSVLGSLLFGFSEPAFFAIIGSFGLACFPWIYLYYMRSGRFEEKYVEDLHKAIEEQTQRRRKKIKQELTDLGCPEGAMQLDKFQAKFDSLDKLLADKLDPNELTFKRYRGIALEVFLSGIDNLSDIVLALKSISEIDVDYVNNRINRLQASVDNGDKDTQNEIEALKARLNVHQKQRSKVRRLLLENERAMTQLDETTVAIADMDTGQEEAEIDMENSMKLLAEITERAKRFSQQNTLSEQEGE